MTTARAWLDQVNARTNAATDGPWTYGGQGWVFAPYAPGPTPIVDGFEDLLATVDTDEVGVFIAHARTDLPAMSAALRAVLDLHAFVPVRPGIHSHKCRACQTPYPCPTVRAVTTALEDA